MADAKMLRDARRQKKDEFYTQLSDIENELRHYKSHFKGKTVLCNCDDPRVSNFFHYFAMNFEAFGLHRLITTCYKNQDADLFSQNDSEQAVWLEYWGDKNGNRVPDPEEIGIKPLKGDGDFRSQECIELLKQADIVVTNPPFSLFRERGIFDRATAAAFRHLLEQGDQRPAMDIYVEFRGHRPATEALIREMGIGTENEGTENCGADNEGTQDTEKTTPKRSKPRKELKPKNKCIER